MGTGSEKVATKRWKRVLKGEGPGPGYGEDRPTLWVGTEDPDQVTTKTGFTLRVGGDRAHGPNILID